MGTRDDWKQLNVLVSPQMWEWIHAAKGKISKQVFVTDILEKAMAQQPLVQEQAR